MNGDQKPRPPMTDGQHFVPAHNPPSLTEPTARPAGPLLPAPVTDETGTPQPAGSGAAVTETGGFYHPETETAGASSIPKSTSTPTAENLPADDAVTWTLTGDALLANAGSWRRNILILALVLGPVIYLITRSIMSAGSVVLVALLFGFMGARKPQPITYRLDRRGIFIGQKPYAYGEFRAFMLVAENGAQTVNLVPLRRFAPLLSIHLDDAKSTQIIATLSDHLPMETPRRDAIDQIVSKIIRI